MSLINDALKKAQKQRTGEAPSLGSLPSVGGESPQRIAKRAKPAGFDTLIIRAGVGAGIALLLVVGGYFVFRSAPEDRGQRTQNSPTQTASTPSPAVTPTSPAPSPVLRPPSSQPASAAPAFTLPVAQTQKTEDREPRTAQTSEPTSVLRPPSSEPAKPAPAPTGSDPRVSPFSAPSASAQASRPAPQASAAQVASPPPPKLEPRAIQFIENIKVGRHHGAPHGHARS
jgi:cytoskeletal protein RodZ